jgi:DNA-binding response OmpR family regulator
MPSAKRVLLVDGEAMLRASLAEQLRADDAYEPVEARGFAEGLALASEGYYEFLVVDAKLPDGDGCELVRALRDAGVVSPILLLQGANEDRARGHESGADDVIVKPFRFAVLLARANAFARSHERSEEPDLRIGPYLFRPHAKLLANGETLVRLTEKETDILKFLHRAGGVVSRETLLHEVWGYNPDISTHTLETHIYRLRKKIESDAGRDILVTDEGGYRLVF